MWLSNLNYKDIQGVEPQLSVVDAFGWHKIHLALQDDCFKYPNIKYKASVDKFNINQSRRFFRCCSDLEKIGRMSGEMDENLEYEGEHTLYT